MSKESKGRDRWNQLGTSRYQDVCPGCGFYLAANGHHRDDCTRPQENRA
ncbi:hypothetical protein [Mycobacterium sp. NPDC050041]